MCQRNRVCALLLLRRWSVISSSAPKEYILMLTYFLAAFSAFLDLYLAVYPATQLSRLSCSLKKKVSLSIMLGLGVL